MISGDELAFVRLAMRKRLLRADQVKQAVERKKWDTPDRSLRSILIDMGALGNDEVVNLRDELRAAKRRPPKERETQVGRDARARGSDDSDSGSGVENGIPAQLGNYKLLKLLGAGAMGAVYDAINLELQRPVALKLLLTEGAPSPRAVQRFKREARLAARLDHPNVVRIYEAGQDQGYHFIAMDKVVGHSVAELITLAEMTPRRAAHVMRKVCLAVGYAHRQEVIHRDLKPANILVEAASGEARVTDFGLAVLAEPEPDDRLTRTGAAVGTPAYMAPEQVRGQLDKIDGRTDIYSLGATFFEMMTSSPPFEAPTFLELAKKICDAHPGSPRKRNRDVPPDLETICLKALEKRKEDRYQTADEMAEDLANFLNDEEIVAQRPSLATRFGRWARRRPALMAGLVGFLAVVIGAAGFYLTLPGTIEVTSVPSEAEVLVDGEARGSTPLTLELSAGVHSLRFRKAGYLDQALGIDTIQVGHGSSFPVPVSLVSVKGVLEVPAFSAPGARVRIYAEGGLDPLREAATPFEGALPEGPYEVEVSAPGYRPSGRVLTKVSAGGLTQALAGVELELDPTQVAVSADPEGVVLAWSRGDGRFPAPHRFGGAGKHLVTGYKQGYLPRRLELNVAPGDQRAAARLTLPPLAAARLPLEGQLLGRPVLDDIDADGALDVLALVEGVGGRALVLLPGKGHAGPRYRIRTEASELLGVYDLDLDGDLDAVLGGARGIEVREGLKGGVLLRLPVDGRRTLLLARYGRLAYARSDGEVELRPLSFVDDGRPWLPANRWGAPPAFLPLSARAVAAYRGGFSYRGLQDEREKRPAAQVETGALLIPVRAGETEYLLSLGRRGPAQLYLAAGGSSVSLGDEGSRFSEAVPLTLPQGSYVFLFDAEQGRTRAFELPSGGAPRELSLSGAGLPATTEEGTEESRVWTSTGLAYRVTREGWFLDELRSTDASSLVDPSAPPLVADLDGDGRLEIAIPSPDRRALLVLEPDGSWLSWRARGGGRARAILEVDGQRLLALARGSRVRFLDLADGRELPERALELPSDVFAIAASPGAKSALFVAYGRGRAEQRTLATLQVFQPLPRAGWKSEPPVELAGVPRGLTAILRRDAPLLALGAPLGLLDADLKEVFRDQEHDPERESIVAAPVFVDGRTPLVVGAREDRQGVFHLVGIDLNGGTPRTRELGSSAEQAPLAIAGAAGVEVVAVQQTKTVSLIALPTLAPSGQIVLEDDLSGLYMTSGIEPVLFLAYRSGRLEARVPSNGGLLWTVELPQGARAPSSVCRLGINEAVAVVAPSGALLLLGLRQGSYLGELKSLSGGFEQVEFLPEEGEGRPAMLLVSASDDHVLAVPVPPLERGELSLRQRVSELRAAVQRGEPDLSAALPALVSLASTQPRPQVQLALAECYLGQGNAEKALEVVSDALRDPSAATPLLLRVQIHATYLARQSLESIRPLLEALRLLDARAAAGVAHELALRGGPDERALIELATTLDPRYGPARTHLAQLLLRASCAYPVEPTLRPTSLGIGEIGRLAKEVWRGSREELRTAYGRAVDARFAAQHALMLQETPQNRALALVAAALERALLIEVANRGQKGTAPLLVLTTATLELLGQGGATNERSTRLLLLARRLVEADRLSPVERANVVQGLYALEPEWLEALCAIQSFTR